MNLYLIGHDYRYAAEQMLLTLFPDERPEYPDGRPTGDRAELRLMSGTKVTTVTCVLVYHGQTANGRTSVPNGELTDPAEKDRRLQGAIKRAFYRAAMGIGLPHRPWGMLTGVRPGKLMTPLLAQGLNDAQAARQFERQYDVSPARADLVVRTAHATLRAMESLGEKDVCLYVGIPFCPTRCAYCSFVSQSVEKSMALVPEFLQALAREIAATAEAVRRAGLRVVSLYIGGGTPTTLSARQLDALCTQLAAAFDLSALREFTVEAGRPDTITADKLHVLRLVRETGGFAVNMDLIAGLPGDTPDGFRATLEQVLALAPENVTVHTLSRKRGSNLMAQDAPIPDGAAVGEMLDFAGTVLPRTGYAPYYLYRQKFMSGGFENVGWTRPGQENLYNICIMEELCSILAMGGGASTKLVRPNGGRLERHIDPKYPTEYIANIDRICAAKAELEAFFQ